MSPQLFIFTFQNNESNAIISRQLTFFIRDEVIKCKIIEIAMDKIHYKLPDF